MNTPANTNFLEPIYDMDVSTHYKMEANMALYDGDESNTKLSIFFNDFEIPEYIPGERSYTVMQGDEYRFDNIAYGFYGTPELLWVIMLVNNIVNPFKVESGTVLRIPPKDWIVYNILKRDDVTESEVF